jgi:hypothetical protein
MRFEAHLQLYQKNPEGYRNLTRSVFHQLKPFTNLYARVEFLWGDEVAIDLVLRDPAGRLTPVKVRSVHSISGLDEEPELLDAIRNVEDNAPYAQQSLERLQEALIQELITGQHPL